MEEVAIEPDGLAEHTNFFPNKSAIKKLYIKQNVHWGQITFLRIFQIIHGFPVYELITTLSQIILCAIT